MLIVSFTIRHSVARRWICGVVSRTELETKSFSLLTQPSLFIFCLRLPLAWPGLSGASLRRYHAKMHSTSPANLHSLVLLLESSGVNWWY